MSSSERQWLGLLYGLGVLSSILAVAQLSPAAMALSIIGNIVLYFGPFSGRISPVAQGHRRWLRWTVTLPIIIYLALYAFFGREIYGLLQTPSWDFWEIFVEHFFLHSMVTTFIGVWLIYRLLRGGLRYIDGAAI